jgi:UDP-glucose 4-epimerase
MKILVTGGTGYIGSHTVVELIQSGYEVIIADSLINSDLDVLEGIEQITGIKPIFEKIDLTDRISTLDFFSRNKDIKAVIHFAALKAVGESVDKPLLYYRNNLDSLMNVLEGINEQNINSIVFSSSCTIYGEPDLLPVTEDTPIKKAESPYGNTKQIAEEILDDHCKTTSLNCIALRYFNPVGAHESGIIGERPQGIPNNLIPYVTQTALGIREYLNVFGNDYNTPDGTAIRDYIHVSDLSQAHVYALKYLLDKKGKGEIEYFNLGTGTGYSVLDIINTFERVNDLKLNYQFKDRRKGDIEKIWADPTKIINTLGWKASRSLEDMMKSAWRFENKNVLKKD